ncbi:hypothetical protein LXL04_021818 [Taraxacum kok-saghyz]
MLLPDDRGDDPAPPPSSAPRLLPVVVFSVSPVDLPDEPEPPPPLRSISSRRFKLLLDADPLLVGQSNPSSVRHLAMQLYTGILLDHQVFVNYIRIISITYESIYTMKCGEQGYRHACGIGYFHVYKDVNPMCQHFHHGMQSSQEQENRSGRLLKSYLKNIFKITVLRFLSNSISCYYVFQHGIIARRLSTQKVPHLTKPTSKLPVPNAMSQMRSKNKC